MNAEYQKYHNRALSTYSPWDQPPRLFLPFGRRPVIPFRLRDTYTTHEEYFGVYMLGVRSEQDLAEDSYCRRYTDITMHAVEVAGAGDRAFLGYISFPTRDAHVDVGDSIRVNLNPTTNNSNDDFLCEITEISPMGRLSQLTVPIRLPSDKTTQQLDDFKKVPLLPVALQTTIKETRGMIAAATPTKIVVSFDSSNMTYDCWRKAQAQLITKLHNSALDKATHNKKTSSISNNKNARESREEIKTLLGNQPNTLARLDIFASLALFSKSEEHIARFHEYLRPEQSAAIQQARNAYGGISLVGGGAGTGKTELISAIMAPLATAHALQSAEGAATAQRFGALIICPTNRNADANAQKQLLTITNARKFKNLSKPAIVIRCGDIEKTERSVFLQDANNRRPQNQKKDGEPVFQDSVESNALLAQLTAAKKHREIFETSQKQKFPGIQDKRVQDLPLSLGTYMKRILGLGLLGEGDKLYEPRRWNPLREDIANYSRGVQFSPHQEQVFTSRISELYNHVFQIADVVVCTATRASEPRLYNAFRPVVIFLDEAAKCFEMDLWPIFAFWVTASTSIVLLGDEKQTKPFIQSNQKINGAYKVLALSPIERLRNCGYLYTELTVCSRYTTEICSFVSNAFYERRLTVPTINKKDSEPVTRTVQKFIEAQYGIQNSNMVLISIDNSVCKTMYNPSKFNIVSAAYAMHLLSTLIGNGCPPSRIAYVTGYLAQKNIMTRIVELLKKQYPTADWSRFWHGTIDNCQGDEADVGIFDLTITNELGFFRDATRLTTACTRFKQGLFVIGNTKEHYKMPYYTKTALCTMLAEFSKRRCVYTIKEYKVPEQLKEELPATTREDMTLPIR